MRLLIGLSLAVCMASAPATAASAAASEQGEKKVCKRVQPHDTGSNLRKRSSRVCMTEAQWKQIDEQTQKNVDTIRDKSNTAVDVPTGMSGAVPQ